MAKRLVMEQMNRREFVKRCLKDYYEEDKKILIDPSVCKIFCAQYLLGDLIYFGNEILVYREMIETLKDYINSDCSSKWKQIRKRNAEGIISKMETDAKAKFNEITLPKAKNKADRIAEYLRANAEVLFYLADEKLYQDLLEKGFRHQLYFMNEQTTNIRIFKQGYQYETIGAIQFNNGKMFIFQKEGVEIKVFDPKGRERTGSEVKERDFVLLKSNRGNEVTVNRLYQIVSRHTRNHALLIIWTDLKSGERSNEYIQRLPYFLQKIIADNN